MEFYAAGPGRVTPIPSPGVPPVSSLSAACALAGALSDLKALLADPPRASAPERDALFRPKRPTQFSHVYRHHSGRFRVRLRLFKHRDVPGAGQGAYVSLPGMWGTPDAAAHALAQFLRLVYGPDWPRTAYKRNGRFRPPVAVKENPDSPGRWDALLVLAGRAQAVNSPDRDALFPSAAAARAAAEAAFLRRVLPGYEPRA
jgi:hypothetical protein